MNDYEQHGSRPRRTWLFTNAPSLLGRIVQHLLDSLPDSFLYRLLDGRFRLGSHAFAASLGRVSLELVRRYRRVSALLDSLGEP